jgi:exopolysaccharide biosynthesis polyprenyl glycosylphosphotransferase
MFMSVRDGDLVGLQIASIMQSLIPVGSIDLAQLVVAVLLGLTIFKAYGPGDKRRDVRALVGAAAAGVVLVCWSWLWTAPSWFHMFGCATMVLGVAGALTIERLSINLLVRHIDGAEDRALRSVVVGPRDAARGLLHNKALRRTRSYSLLGYVDTRSMYEGDALGGLAELIEIIDQYRVETIILSADCDAKVYRQVLDIADAAGSQVLLAPHWARCADIVPQLVWRHGLPLVALTRPSLRGQQLILKRAFDLVAASLGLIVLAPVFVAAAIAVRLSSSGPIFFSQLRVGLGGRHFRMYKFRSMTEGAEEKLEELATASVYADRRLFKITNDPRITRVGRFLRRSSIDELPQLWNVLRGEMSLVGPRPPLPAEVSLYSEHHYSRFYMKPGITGPWQVSGRNRITDFEQVVRIENEHMHQWTFWKDMQVLLRTIPAILKMDGAQ